MFDDLARAVEAVDVPPVADALVDIVGLQDQLQAKVLAAVGEFDANGSWAFDSATSMTAWLRQFTDRSNGEAHRLTRRASLLRRLPGTAAAFGDGRLSGGQLEAVLANLTERTVDRFAEHEPTVLPSLLPLPAADVATSMQLWRARAEALLNQKEPPDQIRALHLSPSLDRRWHGSIGLDDEGGTTLSTAVRLATSNDAEGEDPRSPARKRADALVDIAQFFLDHQQTNKGGRHRPHVNVVANIDDVNERRPGFLVGGGPLPYDAIETLLCDCAIHRVVVDGKSTILDYGRATKTVPAPLFNALVLRDVHCRQPGCDRGADWCDAHHVRHWIRGGPTKLSNLVLKCKRHHHLGHRKGWSEMLLPDGTLVITDADGRRMTSHPPGTLLSAQAA